MQRVGASGFNGNLEPFNQLETFREDQEIICRAEDLLPKICNMDYITDQDVKCHRWIKVRYEPSGLEWQPYEVNGEIRYSESSRGTQSFKVCNYLSTHRKVDMFEREAYCDDGEFLAEHKKIITATIRDLDGIYIQYVLDLIRATISIDNRVGTEATPILVSPDNIHLFIEQMLLILTRSQAACNLSELVLLVPREFRTLLLSTTWIRQDATGMGSMFSSGETFRLINGVEVLVTDWVRPVAVTATEYSIPMMLINRRYIAFYGKITHTIDIGSKSDHNNPTAETMHMYATHGGFNIKPETHVLAYIRFPAVFTVIR